MDASAQTPPAARLSAKVLGKKTAAEFFAGIGLMRLGLEAAGWRVAFANDIDEVKRSMYRDRFPNARERFRLEDIHLLDPDDVPTVTLATASFPCNDLSLAGMRGGLRGAQSSAYWGFVGLLRKMGERIPPIVLLENVAGFLTSNGGRDFREALLALNALGYAVDALVLDAERFVPQSRVRLFVVGSLREGGGAEDSRKAVEADESTLRPRSLRDFILSHDEIVWRIGDLPEPPRRNKTLAHIIEPLPDDSAYWWSEERAEYLVRQMSQKHLAELERMKAKRKWSYGTVFRRIRNGRSMAEMRTDGIAGCLRTPRGGSGRQILVRAGYGKVRARLLTPRECARLMGADDFPIARPLNQALFGFGDAVCVPVIAWLAENYLNPLARELAGRHEEDRRREGLGEKPGRGGPHRYLRNRAVHRGQPL